MMSVSIIIPAYITSQTGMQYLAECLDSCDGQADEVVVWDDGSPLTVLQLQGEYHWVTFHRGKHVGKGYSRNNAVKMIHTDFLYPQDADDMLIGDAVAKLLSKWDGIPLYSDVIKVFDGGLRKYHQLQAFDCGESCKHSIAPVNVLHTKQQWEAIGGWDETNNLFEDWDYNARVFWMFCARKVDSGLVLYRQHEGQSTNAGETEKHRAELYVKNRINVFVRRQAMAGCCGQRRTATDRRTNVVSNPVQSIGTGSTADVSLSVSGTLADPGPGNVWARYVDGKGMGKHSRRAMKSRKVYKVMYGDLVQARAEDVVTEEQFNAGTKNGGLVQIKTTPIINVPPPVPVIVRKAVERTPAKVVERTSVQDDNLEEMVGQISNMSIREIRDTISVLDATTIKLLIEAEKSGKNRVGAVKIMEKELDRVGSKE